MDNTIPATAGFNEKIASGVFSGLKKIPYIKNKIASPKAEKITKKIISIAIELFKASAIIAAGALFGALVGLGFGGPIPIIISAAVGGLSAGIAFFGTKAVLAVIKKYCYPSKRYRTEKAISLDQWRNEDNLKAFKEVLDSFKDEEWFQSWLTLKGYSKCNNFMWRKFQNGFCYGESHALLKLIRKASNASSSDLLGALTAKEVFRKQILENIRADFSAILAKNKHHKIKGLRRRELKAQLAALTEIAEEVHPRMKKYPACHFDRKMLLNYSKFETHPTNYAVKGKRKQFAGIIRIEGKKQAHTIFMQYKKGHYRIYDGYHHRYTGFYKYPNQEAFLRGLHKHLRTYATVPDFKFRRYNSATIQLYGFN